MVPRLHDRHFTLPTARHILSGIKSRVQQLVDLKRHLDGINYNIYKHEYFGGLGPNGAKFHPQELTLLVSIMRYLEEQGIVVKSIDEGLIDFPCLRSNGDEVYLCWKLGEEDIGFWHAIPDGFPGRQSIELL